MTEYNFFVVLCFLVSLRQRGSGAAGIVNVGFECARMEYIMNSGGRDGRGQNNKETDDRAIALFDSGMGGLTCVKALERQLPGESIIYYGDCLRAPYGDRSVETLKVFSQQIADFLTSFPVKMLVVACNTISSLCLGNLKDRYPTLPVVGMIDMTVKTVAGTYADWNIGLIATSAAIKSGVYEKKLRESGCKGEIYPLACPSFVPAVEAGIYDGPQAEAIVRDALDEYMGRNKPSALILGCTHFPFLRPAIEKLYPSVLIIDPAEIVARGIKNMIEDHTLAAGSGADVQQHFYTSKLTDAYAQAVKEISENGGNEIKVKVFGE